MAKANGGSPREILFQIPKDGVPPRKIAVGAGDGLRYVGATKRAVCPHFRTPGLVFDRSTSPLQEPAEGEPKPEPRVSFVLVGVPPQGCSDGDLRAVGIGTCVNLEMVEAAAGSGQWEHVPAASMAPLVQRAEALRDARRAALAPKQSSTPAK